jgi:hypothetical protein
MEELVSDPAAGNFLKLMSQGQLRKAMFALDIALETAAQILAELVQAGVNTKGELRK